MLSEFFISAAVIAFFVLPLIVLYTEERDRHIKEICKEILPLLKGRACEQLAKSLKGRRMFCGIERIKIEGEFKTTKEKDLVVVSKDQKWYGIEHCWFEIKSEKGKWEN